MDVKNIHAADALRMLPALVDALAWYGEQARLCRLIHSGGDAGRKALNDDYGRRAEGVLASIFTSNQPKIGG